MEEIGRTDLGKADVTPRFRNQVVQVSPHQQQYKLKNEAAVLWNKSHHHMRGRKLRM